VPTSIKQLRRWLKGADVEGLPPHPKPVAKPKRPKVKWRRCRECDGLGEDGKTICEVCDGVGSIPRVPDPDETPWVEKMRKKHGGRKHAGGKFRISADGTDALLFFGKHRDKNVSDIAKEDVGYLEWMLKEGEFADDLCEVIKFNVVRHWKRTKKKRWLEHKAMELGMDGEMAKKADRDRLEDYIMRFWDGKEAHII